MAKEHNQQDEPAANVRTGVESHESSRKLWLLLESLEREYRCEPPSPPTTAHVQTLSELDVTLLFIIDLDAFRWFRFEGCNRFWITVDV